MFNKQSAVRRAIIAVGVSLCLVNFSVSAETTAVVKILVPDVSLISKGDVNLDGHIEINNSSARYTIWSGGQVNLSGSVVSSNGYGVHSDPRGNNRDIFSDDGNLSRLSREDFFENFFGLPKKAVIDNASIALVHTEDTNYSSKLDGRVDKVIYLKQKSGVGTLNSGTIGSVDEPVLLILDGQWQLSGNLQVFGVLYIDNTWHNTGSGAVKINGMLIVNGDVYTTDSPNIRYNPSVIDNIKIGVFISHFRYDAVFPKEKIFIDDVSVAPH